MAQPISYIASPRKPECAEHADAIASALDLLQLLHDRGVLDLLRGLVGAGDQMVGLLTDAVNTPDAIRGIRNFLLLTKFFATIPPETLSGLVKTATEGAAREKSMQPAPKLLPLLRRMNSEDSRRGLAVMVDLLEGLGKNL
jgi:uncharacterized protein YjgD (DUF1641 family)